MKILNLFELSAQNRAKLAALGDVEVIDGNELGDNAKNIDVIYGWGSLRICSGTIQQAQVCSVQLCWCGLFSVG